MKGCKLVRVVRQGLGESVFPLCGNRFTTSFLRLEFLGGSRFLESLFTLYSEDKQLITFSEVFSFLYTQTIGAFYLRRLPC